MTEMRYALEVLSDITINDAYANIALKNELKNVKDERVKRFVSALVYTTLEHMSYIDYVSENFIKGKTKKVIQNIIRLGVCQIFFMQRPQSAVCNECVLLCKQIGKAPLSGFVNAVLRNIIRAKESGTLPDLPQNTAMRLNIETGYPMWFVCEYLERFGEARCEAILKAKDAGTSIRAQSPFTVQQLEDYLTCNGAEFEKGRLDSNIYRIKSGINIAQNELFTSGKITIQSESSALVCRVCNVKDGMNFLDACCAPGGKSAYIASLCENKCNITACEVHHHRAELIKNTFLRLNVTCADVMCMDMTVKNESFCGEFDVVLCDVPCSGLGVMGKPDVRLRRDTNDVEAIARLQKSIFYTCAEYVKVGGALVYSTCTVSKRENEDVINDFLKTHSEFTYDENLKDLLPEQLKERCKNGSVFLLPDTDKTDGFFIARLIKRK